MRTPLAVALVIAGYGVAGDAMPRRVGACATTVIPAIGRRFGASLMRPKTRNTDDGTGVELGNGVDGVSYIFVPALANAKVGDPVKTCPVSIPKGCPKGDDPGKVFTTTNLRMQDFRTLGDSRHLCGGAGPDRREGRSGPARRVRPGDGESPIGRAAGCCWRSP